MNDALIAEIRTKLYSGVVSDVLDSLGNMHHALAPGIRPLDETLVMFGRARTALSCLSTMSSPAAILELEIRRLHARCRDPSMRERGTWPAPSPRPSKV